MKEVENEGKDRRKKEKGVKQGNTSLMILTALYRALVILYYFDPNNLCVCM
jgi:hypothetical protein